MIIKKSLILESTDEKVWNYLTKFDRIQKWNECLLEHQKVSIGEPGPGYQSRILMQEGRKNVWYNEEILEYHSQKLLKIKLSGGSLGKAPMIITYELSEIEDGVQLDYTSHWEPKGLMYKLLHGMIESASEKKVEKDLQALKNKVENQ